MMKKPTIQKKVLSYPPPETNIAPEKQAGPKNESSLPNIHVATRTTSNVG